MYRKIDADGKIDEVRFMTESEMEEYVGGFVECVDNIICNENRVRLQLQRNKVFPMFLGNIIVKIKD